MVIFDRMIRFVTFYQNVLVFGTKFLVTLGMFLGKNQQHWPYHFQWQINVNVSFGFINISAITVRICWVHFHKLYYLLDETNEIISRVWWVPRYVIIFISQLSSNKIDIISQCYSIGHSGAAWYDFRCCWTHHTEESNEDLHLIPVYMVEESSFNIINYSQCLISWRE